MQRYLNRKECVCYRPILARGVHVLLQNLLSAPEKWDDHLSQQVKLFSNEMRLTDVCLIFSFTAAIILRIAFGYQLTSSEDVYLEMIRNVSECTAGAGSSGGNPVDFLPFRTSAPILRFPQFRSNGMYSSISLLSSLVHTMQVARQIYPSVRMLYEFPLSEVEKQMVCVPHHSRGTRYRTA
jgi:hypothetical protein